MTQHSIVAVSDRPLAADIPFSALVPYERFDPERHPHAHAFVLDARTPAAARAGLAAIRQSSLPRVYLLPVFLAASEDAELSTLLAAGADAVLPLDAGTASINPGVLDLVDAILARMQQIPQLDQGRDTNLAFKAVRLLYVRGLSAVPERTAEDPQGFAYPPLEPLVDKPDGTIQRLLAFLEGQGLVRGTFTDRIYRCGRCRSAFLSVREACAHCQSFQLDVDDLIHHFRCAHVAPAHDFVSPDGLSCPKCNRPLRHIGVDYDKPSQVYQCLDCGRTAQDVDTLATCYRCGHTASPDAHEVVIVKRYALTALADSAARYGMESLFRQILESELEILPISVFKRLVQLEIERIGRYGRSQSTVGVLQIANLAEIYLDAGGRAREVLAELAAILRSVLRTTDVITTLNEMLFLILFVETPPDGAERALERIGSRVAELVSTNLQREAQSAFRAAPIRGGQTADQVVDALLQLT
jgi:GGDEF domain-containing protein